MIRLGFVAAIFVAFFALVGQALAQNTQLLPGQLCFSALAPTSGGTGGTGTGYIGLLGTITGGSGGTTGTYSAALTGGSGTGATANFTVSGGAVTAVAVYNPGVGYVVGDTLSATSGNIGGVTGFSVHVTAVAINQALAGGSVFYYIPNTITFKQTYKNSAGSILNTNPVILDANGCATVWGAGLYRQVLEDSLGNVISDTVTAVNGTSDIFWAGAASGTPNAIAVTDGNFTNTAGQSIQFLAASENTGAVTISVSSGTPITVEKDTSTGPSALTGGEIGPNNTPIVTYETTNGVFHLINPSTSSGGSSGAASQPTPQGYLNLVGQATGDIIQTTDVVAATTIYYSPFTGNLVPIWNGATFVATAISELTATLTSAGSALNSIQDVCVFSNNGSPTLAIGPAWTTATPGSGSRGTGAGTAQITRLQGLWVNAVSITGYNGLSSFSIGANKCTYLGSISIDGTAGQVSAYKTYGQSRKWGIWNAYNRQPLYLIAGDSTASWNYNTTTFRPANNNTANSLQIFAGLQEVSVDLQYKDDISVSSTNSEVAFIGIGYNSTSINASVRGTVGTGDGTHPGVVNASPSAKFLAPAFLGIETITALESGSGGTATSFTGTTNDQLLSAQWQG